MKLRLRGTLVVLAAVGLLLVHRSGAEAAEHLAVEAAPDPNLGWRIGLTGVRVTQTTPGTSPTGAAQLLIRFSDEIAAVGVEEAHRASSTWVTSLDVGYDSLLVIARPGVAVTLLPTPSGVALRFLPPPTTRQSENAPPSSEVVRTTLAKARLLRLEGELPAALALVRPLYDTAPHDHEVARALASLELEAGRPVQAAAILDPLPEGDEATAPIRRAVTQALAPYGSLEGDLRETKEVGSERIARFRAHAPLAPSGDGRLYLEAEGEVNDVDADPFQRTDGSTRPLKDTRYRASVGVGRRGRDGSDLRASLLGRDDGVGGGVRTTLRDDHGSTTLVAEYQAPSWDYLQTLADGGTRDQLQIRRVSRLPHRSEASIGAGLRRYGVTGTHDALDTASLVGAFSYPLTQGDTSLMLQYLLDGEYRLNRTERGSSPGARFHPVPFRSREL